MCFRPVGGLFLKRLISLLSLFLALTFHFFFFLKLRRLVTFAFLLLTLDRFSLRRGWHPGFELEILGGEEVIHRCHMFLFDIVVIHARGLGNFSFHGRACCLQTRLLLHLIVVLN